MKHCAGCGKELVFPLSENKCPNCGRIFNAREIELPTDTYFDYVTPGNNFVHSKEQISLRYNACQVNGVSGYSVSGFSGKVTIELSIPEFHNSKPVLSIGSNAFRGKKSLISVLIPPSVRRIDESAFEDCSNLHGVSGGDNILYIGENAFKGCIHLSHECELFHHRFGCPPSAFAGCYYLPIRDVKE